MREGGDVVPEGSVVDIVSEDAEEVGGLVPRVGLELRVDLNERGRDSGKRTGRIPYLAGVQRRIRIYLGENPRRTS